MLGKVLTFNLTTGRGKIVLKDGNEVSFTREEWKLPIRPQADILVEYMRGDIVLPTQKELRVEKKSMPTAQQELSEEEVRQKIAALEATDQRTTKAVNTSLKSRMKQSVSTPTKKESGVQKVTSVSNDQHKTKEVTSTKATPQTRAHQETRPLVKSAKGQIETMKMQAAHNAMMEEKKKNGCQAEAYIEQKLAQGYKLVEKDEQHFVLVQKHANRSILDRAQRWLLYTIPLFVAFIIFADEMSLARSILDTLLQINVILLLGTLATLYWQGYVSEAFKVKVKGNCKFDKLVVDDSEEVEFFQKRAA